ncbi:MAG: type II toxin-antitoxin system VapC family toxin [Okeania sp. SIO3B5]|uniref:type II toxin-antitoxin system tRNA(fMet)-specific endonuclease VapC n=1 Tax=Okeania sp. SIO3B5 TaxID=2607811 RepID=UPI0014005CB0|nr:type II toxin-antitoxin system VapC family toxin [Okeania sp. SIO3B5]NEO52336.1 type II toxin-antitoxin system VapC family toxin [Okeania sp. SIO3B5]
MIYLLDTNACIVYLKGLNSQLKQRLESHNPRDIVVCSVVKAELFYGAKKSQKSQQNLIQQRIFLKRFISLPFDDRCTEIYGEIRANLETRGMPIWPYDLQIASIAIANDLILVTHNMAEFQRISELNIEDWEV